MKQKIELMEITISKDDPKWMTTLVKIIESHPELLEDKSIKQKSILSYN